MAVKTLQENINDFVNEVQGRKPSLTDTTEGSTIDTFAGATAYIGSEIARVVLDMFAKTFFESANGPEVTGGPDDLQTLAVDHFGEDFRRPESVKASGTVTFSRVSTAGGNVVIPLGTLVKTRKNADGVEYVYETTTTSTMTGTSLTLAIQATDGGTDYNVAPDTITVVESALTDPTVGVTNIQTVGGGSDAYTDPQYRDWIRLKLTGFRVSVVESIESSAKTVAGIVYATGVVRRMVVIEYDIATGLPKVGAVFFRIPFPTLYIAGSGGTASADQIADVKEAIKSVASYGVHVNVESAVASTLDWSVQVVLNSTGPNYASFLSGDFTLVTDSMEEYLALLPIGSGFDKDAATAAIFAIWGPSGTGDLLSLTTTAPGASIAGVENQKLIPGTMGVG